MERNSDRKQRLVDLGSERLADVLLELAGINDAVDDLVGRIIATPLENIQRFKAKLTSLKRSRRFIRWGESAAFARELLALLEDLRAGVSDPRTGVELVAAFYQCDKGALGNCDDSSGHVGDVFRHDARELFISFASCCSDKAWLGELLLKLNRADDYGVRDVLIDGASDYLPEAIMRNLVARFQKNADQAQEEYPRRHWLRLVESLARQLKDAPLFERTRLAAWGSLSTAACVDIARVYLECGDVPTALAWLEKVPEREGFGTVERDILLFEVYGKLEDTRSQGEVAWRMFRHSRSLSALERLLGVIGSDQRDLVVAGEVAGILGSRRFSTIDAAFLIAVARIDEAQTYLLTHADQLDGMDYCGLLPLAEAMEKNGGLVCASLLYRTLLDSILHRAQSKIYPHGVRYLRKLDQLAAGISNWLTIVPHPAYKESLRLQHGRKSSFWSLYGKSGVSGV